MILVTVLLWLTAIWTVGGIAYLVASAMKGYSVIDPAMFIALVGIFLIVVTIVAHCIDKDRRHYTLIDQSAVRTNALVMK